MRALPAVLLLAFAFGMAPTRSLAQETTPPGWLGITLDGAAAQLRAALGDPVRITRLPEALAGSGIQATPDMQPERKARYVLSFTKPLFLIVSERHGAVVGIEVLSDQPLAAELVEIAPDPSGIVLGATDDAVLKAHPDAHRMQDEYGARLFAVLGRRYIAAYGLAGGRVRSITWFARAGTDPPVEGPALSEPAGDSPATAILDLAKTETDGILWERIWSDSHPCDGTNRWVKGTVATSHANGRVYDAIRYTCPSTGATRTVYFDITAFFGKFG
jgi:hypothetical protein